MVFYLGFRALSQTHYQKAYIQDASPAHYNKSTRLCQDIQSKIPNSGVSVISGPSTKYSVSHGVSPHEIIQAVSIISSVSHGQIVTFEF